MSIHTFAYWRKRASWDTRASVRVKTRRVLLREGEESGKVIFSPELVPIARHPRIRQADPGMVRDLQVQHLDRDHDFTTRLELELINEVSKEIALGKLDADLPDAMRQDAFKLCTDEAHHAYFSDDV